MRRVVHLMMWLALADCFMVFLELLWNGTKQEVWSTTSPKLKVIVTTVSLQVKFMVGDSSHANWKGQVQELLCNQVSYDSFAQRLQNIYLLQTHCKDIDNIEDVEKLSTHASTLLNRPIKWGVRGGQGGGRFTFLADPGEARGCSTNRLVIN